MIDPNKPQAWFCHVCFEDIYHGELLVIQGTLGETVKKLHYFSERTGAVCKVYATQPAQIPLQSAFQIKCAAEEGTLLACVATINRDYDFAEWKRCFTRVFEQLKPEQRLAEFQNLEARLNKEIAAIELLLDRRGDAVPAQESPAPPTTTNVDIHDDEANVLS